MVVEVITFKDVHFSYAGEPGNVLHGSSFTVCKGDRVAFKGESGSGKTTIFRLILGFEQQHKGSILYKGEQLNSKVIRRLRQESAWLPQDLSLGSGSVEDVLAFPFQFATNELSAPNQDTTQKVFEKLGLNRSHLQSKFSELSTGQRQRVGIAICHLMEKPLLLLDEPTSALDQASKQKAIDLLFKDSKRTILSTSHDPYWVDQCNKVIELE